MIGYLIDINMSADTFELTLFKSFRFGWTILDHPDYALLIHTGFLQPGVTLMLSWRKNG